MHVNTRYINSTIYIQDVPLVEFMYLVFTHLPGESYRRWLGSLLLCDIFWAQLNSLVCWFCRSTLGLVPFQTCANTYSTPFAHLNTTNDNVPPVQLTMHHGSPCAFKRLPMLPSYMDTYHDPLVIQTCFISPCVHSNTYECSAHTYHLITMTT